MNDRDSIISWIYALPEDAGPQKVSKKRKRQHQHRRQLASPPTPYESDESNSKNGSEMPSTPKKRRLAAGADNEGDDLDATPRAGSHSVSYSNTSSTTSAASSPKKHMLNLRLCEFAAVVFKKLNVQKPPEPARRLVKSIVEIGRGHILPHGLKSTIMEQVKARGIDDSGWSLSFKPAEVVDNLPGRIPTLKEVVYIYEKASECQDHGHEEVGWNHQVYMRLLENIFENGVDGLCDNFNAANWYVLHF